MKVNVGIIGHVDHGKTTLTAALVRVLSSEMLVTETRSSIMDDYDEYQEASPYPGRAKNPKRKAAWKAKLKAVQFAAMQKGS